MSARGTGVRGCALALAFLCASAVLARAANAPPIPTSPPPIATASPAPAPPSAISADAARVVGDDHRTRFVLDLSGVATFTVFSLADPYRLVIDLPEIRFALPEGTGSTGAGMISAFRYGLISAGRSRIVLDLTTPAHIDRSFVLPAVQDQPARLVLDLVPTSREAFVADAQRYRETEAAQPQKQAGAVGDKDGKVRIVIDPGHGGIDSGAHGVTGTLEKNVVLAFAKVLAQKLQANGHYQVFLTRTDDTFVALGERVAFARQHDADLFISVHANSFLGGGGVRGATVYTLSDRASDKMAEEMANSENSSDVLAGVDMPKEDGDDVKNILLDLTRRETKNFGVVFAQNLVKEMGNRIRLFKLPHQEASFKVLEAPDVPSALIELGYMSNRDDEKLLNSDDWRDRTAAAAAAAVDDYFATRFADRTSP